MDKDDHSTIRRERRLGYGIRKIGELDVLGACERTSMRVKEKKYCRYDSYRDARHNELPDYRDSAFDFRRRRDACSSRDWGLA
jgi:hypothetical protein